MRANELNYYQQELSYLKQLGPSFGQANSKIAARLAMANNQAADPHMERLIEGLALLNAKVQANLDKDFAYLTQAVIDSLMPHYLAPLPAMSIVQFHPNNNLTRISLIEAGTEIISEAYQGVPCRFTICSTVELVPLQVVEAKIINHESMSAYLKLQLQFTGDKESAGNKDWLLAINTLRFFIQAENAIATSVYELLFYHTQVIKLVTATGSTVIIPLDYLIAPSLTAAESLLPKDARVSPGAQLLMDYFALPEKFLFFELRPLQAIFKETIDLSATFSLYFYFNQPAPQLENQLQAKHFALNCTPIINLFSCQSEVIQLDYTKNEYPLWANVQYIPQAHEVYAVTAVSELAPKTPALAFMPFWSAQQATENCCYENHCYWQWARKPSSPANPYQLTGDEAYISFYQAHLQPQLMTERQVVANLLCSNRDLPNRLPFGGVQPALTLAKPEQQGIIARVNCLMPFTPVKRLSNDLQTHVACMHLAGLRQSLSLASLQAQLKLYHFKSPAEAHLGLVNGLLALTINQKSWLNPQASLQASPYLQGLEIMLEVDESYFVDVSLFLFAKVLSQVLPHYCDLATVTQLIVTTKQRGKLYVFAPQYPNIIG